MQEETFYLLPLRPPVEAVIDLGCQQIRKCAISVINEGHCALLPSHVGGPVIPILWIFESHNPAPSPLILF